jgi:preprotein translocase subunit SecA
MTLPSLEYRRTLIRRPPPLPKGFDALAHNVSGMWRMRNSHIDELVRMTWVTEQYLDQMRVLSDRHLRDILDRYHMLFRRHRGDNGGYTPHALAAIREAAMRTVGLRPYPEQIFGALAMNHRHLAEMATGEGKTLTAALAAVLVGWTHLPVHIVTVNDYLAQRDADWFRSLYQFCGLKTGCVTGAMEPLERRQAYDAHITYTTSKELLADFLRDRIRLERVSNPQRRLIRTLLSPRAAEREQLVTRGLHACIVDEADSVLIDEAVTPLIIAQKRDNPMLREACKAASALAEQLEQGRDYKVNLRYREIELTETGKETVETLVDDLPPVWRGAGRRRELLEQAITARVFYLRGKHYVVEEEAIVIVDEFTGRIMPNRSWSEGLHQAVEAKEGVIITEPNETVARLSFQRFFRLFPHLSGMTGTASEAASEFWRIYRLPILRIPTHRPCIREVAPEQIFAAAEDKWQAIVDEIVRIHATGRPVLVGTRNVDASERLGQRLMALELEFNLLNAVRHAEEARIVAEAGLPGKITIATNMAGRGTDIKLAREVADIGGLHVIATERHESARIDRQLFGRAARQGDPGSAQGYVSLEDDLFKRFTPEPLQKTMRNILQRKPENAAHAVAYSIDDAQQAAEKLAFRQRRAVLNTDTWLDESLSFADEGGL